METKFTKGPWIAGDDEDSDFYLVGPEIYPGIVASPVVRLHDEGNARLIAAAPELLEALQMAEKKLLELENMVGGGDGEVSVEIEILTARAAIAKATGAV